MSTHNICFHGEIRKISAFFGWKKCLICCCALGNQKKQKVVDFLPIFLQGRQLFLWLPANQPPSGSRPLGNKFLPCSVNSFSNGRKTQFWQNCLQKVYPFALVWWVTHFSLETHIMVYVFGKKSVDPDQMSQTAAECHIWTGSTLFALNTGISVKYYTNNKN